MYTRLRYLYQGYIAKDMALDNYIRFFVLIFSLFGVYGGKQAIMYYVYVIYYICIYYKFCINLIYVYTDYLKFCIDITQSNEGNEFALVFFENLNVPTFTVFVTTPEDNPVSFTISSQFEEFYFEGVAMPDQVTSFYFEQSFALVNTIERGKAIIVKAQGDHKLAVYGANEALYTTDAFLALPSVSIESGTYKYITAMATPWDRYDSFIEIVAFENNTIMSITPNIDTTIGSTFTAAGTTTQITLHKYESFLIRQKGDLTGTRVISDKPISFITGHLCTNVPPDIGGCNHLVEQIPPVQNWGKRFATVPLKTRRAYDRFKVVAGEDFTTVQIECTQSDGQSGYSASFILQEGGFKDIDIPSTDYCWIEGDKRIILLQFSVGQEVDNVLSDPFMAMIPPVDQYSNGYTLATVPDGVQNYTHFINLYIPKDFFKPCEIFLNEQSLEEINVNFTAIQSLGVTEVYGAQVEIIGGVQTLRHSNKSASIGVLVYGFSHSNSYGYSGGLKLKTLSVIKEETGCLNYIFTSCMHLVGFNWYLPQNRFKFYIQYPMQI